MIASHYWPHLSIDAASRDVRLAEALRRAGLAIEVLTPRYAASWPDKLTHREVVVHRPIAAARSQWSISRYFKHLEAWMVEHGANYDVLFCTSMQEDALATLQAAGRLRAAAIVQHSGTAAAADHRGWASMRHGRRLRSLLPQAEAIVVNWASTQRELIAMGIAAEQLRRIDLGVPAGAAPPLRDAHSDPTATVLQSRLALAAVNGDLGVHRNSLVVMACGQMNRAGNMQGLARALPALVETWSDLRLWLIGDGDQRESLHAYFRHQGIRQNVAMPGTFVDFEDLFRLADVLVVPSAADALEDTLGAAVAAAVPLVVLDGSDARAYFNGAEHLVGWCPGAEGESLRAALHAALVDLPARRDAAQRLRRLLLRQRPYDQTVRGYKQLFASLAATTRDRPTTATGSLDRTIRYYDGMKETP